MNVLPLTRDTQGLLDAKLFAALPEGAYLINMGRGGHVVGGNLCAAIDSGHLSGAALGGVQHRAAAREPSPTGRTPRSR